MLRPLCSVLGNGYWEFVHSYSTFMSFSFSYRYSVNHFIVKRIHLYTYRWSAWGDDPGSSSREETLRKVREHWRDYTFHWSLQMHRCPLNFRKQRGCKRIQLPEQVWTLWASLTVLLTPPLWDTHDESILTPPPTTRTPYIVCLPWGSNWQPSAQFPLAWANSALTSTAHGPAVTAGQLVEQH